MLDVLKCRDMEKTNVDKMESRQLIAEIKNLIRTVRWSQNQAAEVIYCAECEIDIDEELKAFQAKFKKQLQRESTPVERLGRYLEILAAHDQVKKSGVVLNAYVPSGTLSQELSAELRLLSDEVVKKIRSGDIG